MPTTTATIKGQVTIPAPLRKKLNIHQGTKISIKEQRGKSSWSPCRTIRSKPDAAL